MKSRIEITTQGIKIRFDGSQEKKVKESKIGGRMSRSAVIESSDKIISEVEVLEF